MQGPKTARLMERQEKIGHLYIHSPSEYQAGYSAVEIVHTRVRSAFHSRFPRVFTFARLISPKVRATSLWRPRTRERESMSQQLPHVHVGPRDRKKKEEKATHGRTLVCWWWNGESSFREWWVKIEKKVKLELSSGSFYFHVVTKRKERKRVLADLQAQPKLSE